MKRADQELNELKWGIIRLNSMYRQVSVNKSSNV